MPWQEFSIKSSLHLLIVEDVMADLELVVLTLEAANITFTYDTANNLSDCQQLLQTKTYDVVLASYCLPQFTAYQVLKLLQRLKQEIPLILVTSSLGEEAAVECIKSGMTDYVLKERLFRLPMVLERSLQEFTLYRQQQAAVAQIKRQAHQEAIINQITQAMQRTLVLSEVPQTTVDMLHAALKVSRCLIFQPDAQGEMLIDRVSTATVEREKFLGLKYPFYPHYKEKLIHDGPVVVSQIDRSLPLEIQDLAIDYEFCALMIVPLLYQQSFLGGIILHQCDRTERQWTDDEVALVKAIANHCAIAIHQAELFAKVQQQAQREQLLNQVSKALNSSLDPEYILQEIVQLTGKCFGVDRVTIFSINAEQLQVLNEWRSHFEIVSILNYTAPCSEYAELLDPTFELSLFKVFYSCNYSQIPISSTQSEQFEHVQVLSSLRVPIFIRNQLFGGLLLHTTTTYRTFTKDEIRLLQRIADQAAIALYNAQSYELLEELVKQRTQELEAEKLLSEAGNRAKNEFLGTISHELRTPLTGILGFSTILSEQFFGSLNDKQKQYIEGISNCGKHLLELINDLLDLSKIEAGKEDLVWETLLVEEVCQACLSLFREQCINKGLQMSLAIASNVTTCIADQRRLKQILVNLLSNAVKFTEYGSVTLKVEQTEDAIAFSVIDTGIGIALSEQATLFQPFRQLDSGLNRKYEGSGLGLALSRKLAQLHGGTITLHSKLGYGSCFTLHLPSSPPA